MDDERTKCRFLLDLIVPCRQLLADYNGLNPGLKAGLKAVLKELEDFRSLIAVAGNLTDLLETRGDSGLQDALRVCERKLAVSYGVTPRVHLDVKQWEKADYQKYPAYYHPVYGNPIMEEAAPGNTYIIWDKKATGVCRGGEYRLHVLQQLQKGTRALLLHGTQEPISMDPLVLAAIQAKFNAARLNIVLKGITRLSPFATASEIWVDDVSLADELVKNGMTR